MYQLISNQINVATALHKVSDNVAYTHGSQDSIVLKLCMHHTGVRQKSANYVDRTFEVYIPFLFSSSLTLGNERDAFW